MTVIIQAWLASAFVDFILPLMALALLGLGLTALRVKATDAQVFRSFTGTEARKCQHRMTDARAHCKQVSARDHAVRDYCAVRKSAGQKTRRE
jgi:hypothetical protein